MSQKSEVHAQEPGAPTDRAIGPPCMTNADDANAVQIFGMHALVIEDSWHVAGTVRSLLEKLGIEV